MGRRVGVTGGRSNYDYIHIHRVLKEILEPGDILVHGGASGVDSVSAQTAVYLGNAVEQHKANWAKHGKSAGGLRNQKMVDTGPDFVVQFAGGTGTADMVKRCKAAGVRVIHADVTTGETQ